MENENANANAQNGADNDQTVIDASLTAEAKYLALEEQNKKLYARAKKAEGFTQEQDGSWVKKPRQTETVITNETPKPSDLLRSDEFKLYRQGYTEEEIDLIMHNGGVKALSNDKNPLVMGLKVAKEQRGAEAASSQARDSSGASDMERKFSNADLQNMKPAEIEKILGTVGN